MSFISLKFLVFLLIVFVVNWIIAKEHRYIWLLASSYYFYATWNLKYTGLLMLVTICSFFVSRYMGAQQNNTKLKRIVLLISIAALISLIMLFKFWNFWINGLYELFGISDPATGGVISVVAPIGLSFYVLVAIGYMIDVFRLKCTPEKNIGKYALFLAFFPSILSGPIERSGNLLYQINNPNDFDYDRTKKGLLFVLYGFFMKLLVANRLSFIVDAAFENYHEQTGATMAFAILFYGIQLYVDFAGYSCIAIGVGNILGYELLENFKQPYFSLSIQQFWSRWHISLSSWLKDYIYYPLGGNRKGKVMQCINIMITFLVSGVWHGTGPQFMLWGGLHGVYQVLSRIIDPIRSFLRSKIMIKRDAFSFKMTQAILTFILVDYTWLFFRAPSIDIGIDITKNIVRNFHLGDTLIYKLYLMGFDSNRFNVLFVEMVVILVVDLLHEKNISIVSLLNRQNKAFRWGIYLFAVLAIIIGVIHDYGLDASSFIYTRF